MRVEIKTTTDRKTEIMNFIGDINQSTEALNSRMTKAEKG